MSLPFFNKKADFSAFSSQLNGLQITPHLKRIVSENLGDSSFTYTLIEQSTFHHVYHLVTPSQETFLKIAKHSKLQSSLDLEAKLYRKFINPLGIGVNVLNVDISHEKYPFAYLLLAKAPGVCFRAISIDEPNYPLFIRDLGYKLAQVHHISLKSIGYGLVSSLDANLIYHGSYKTWWQFLDDHFESHLSTIIEEKIIDLDDSSWFEICRKTLAAELPDIQQPSLLHGDPGSHNIYVDPIHCNVVSLLDWEDVIIGDPLFELAMFLSFYRMDEFIKPLLDGYNQITPILHNKTQYRLLWLYYLRIVLAKGALRLKLGYDTDNASPTIAKIRLAKQQLKTIL